MTSKLSPVGMLCNDILTAISAIPELPADAGTSISGCVAHILQMTRKNDERMLSARRAIAELKRDLRGTKEELAVLRQEHFGQSSEKEPAQEDDEDHDFFLDGLTEEPKEKVVGKRVSKKPQDITTEIHNIYPDDRTCCTCNSEMPSIGSWASEKFQIVPEHVICIKKIHHKCACNREVCKDNKPVAAKSQSYMMKGCKYEAEFMLEAAVQKFDEHSTSYRMESRLKNCNLNVSRQVIGRNIARVAGFLKPIQDELLAHVTDGHVAHMDETPVRVQAPGKGKCDTGYFWAICRDERRWNPGSRPAVFYKYADTRAGRIATELLSGTAIRVVHVDGYTGYNALTKEDRVGGPIIKIGCWAHARRKFDETYKATKSPLAKRMMRLIQQMYCVEDVAAGLTADQRLDLRQEKTRPILSAIWADLLKNESNSHGKLRGAINYVLKARDAFTYFVEDGRLEIDNNPVERCIRGIAITKKNSLFAGSHGMAEVWAIFFTLIETCKLNKINPRLYLNWAAGEIELNRGDVDYAMLLPWHCPVGRIEV